MLKTHNEETIKLNKDLNEWTRIWWIPIVKALESDDKIRKAYAYEVNFKIFKLLSRETFRVSSLTLKYILPRVIKAFPESINYCQRVSSKKKTL